MAGRDGCSREPTTNEFLRLILRRLTFGNVHLQVLEVSLQTGDRDRMIVAAANLHEIWVATESDILRLQQLAPRSPSPASGRQHHEVARAALLAARYFSREPLTRMWAVLREDVRRHAGDAKRSRLHDADSGCD
jgi:hypothetical protein